MKTPEELDSKIPTGGKTAADDVIAEVDDGVDMSLIRWMLGLTPTERLQAAQDMVNTIWMLRGGTKTN